MSSGPRVVVVGGGAAGLAAASKLFSAGLEEVLVLEASDQLGGRILSCDFGGKTIEMGAQWIHGQKGKTHKVNEITNSSVIDKKV